MEIRIQRVTLSLASRFAPSLADLLHEIGWFAAVNAETLSQTQERVLHHMQQCLSDESHSIYIALGENEEVLGYTSVHWLPYLILKGAEGYVSELFIREAARGHGVGTLLLEAVKAEGKERGCVRLSLINMRNRESYRRGYYRKVGWEERENAANFILSLEEGH
jgi:GNAT superfamily N-acetyltransferase